MGVLQFLIEYDGLQYFKAIGGWNTEEALKATQSRDKQKEDWCKKLNILLYRIKYDDDIEEKLNEIFKQEV